MPPMFETSKTGVRVRVVGVRIAGADPCSSCCGSTEESSRRIRAIVFDESGSKAFLT
jgi:hypothetical protein